MRFNGVELRTVHPALSVAKEIYPGMAAREIATVRGNSGEALAGIREERAEAIVRVNIAGRTRNEAHRARALLAAWAAAGGEAGAALEPTHWTGVAYHAILSGISEPEYTFGHATVDVTFMLPRPYAYEIAEKSAEGSRSVEIIVGGSAKCRPVITQTLSEAAENVAFKADGKTFLQLTGTLSKGAEIEADLANESLIINRVHHEEYINYLSTTWHPAMTPGKHTIASSAWGKIEVRWHDEWI